MKKGKSKKGKPNPSKRRRTTLQRAAAEARTRMNKDRRIARSMRFSGSKGCIRLTEWIYNSRRDRLVSRTNRKAIVHVPAA